MKVELKFHIESVEELMDLVSKLGSEAVTTAAINATEDKPAASRSRGKSKPAAAAASPATTTEALTQQAPSPFGFNAPAQQAPVVEAPVQTPPPIQQGPAFDRNGAIAEVQAGVTALTGLGVQGPAIAAEMQTIYQTIGAPAGKKVSELSDDHVKAFMPFFRNKLAQLQQQAAGNGFSV